jgi:hypothetical protein
MSSKLTTGPEQTTASAPPTESPQPNAQPNSASNSAHVIERPKYPGQQSRTNMGWGSHLPPGKDWPYTILSDDLFDEEFRRLATIAIQIEGRVDSVTFQPFDPSKSEDRLCVQEWALKDGTWTFAAIFDG